MPIDHREAMYRAALHLQDTHQPYAGVSRIVAIAALIDQAVKETAFECSEICRRHTDRDMGNSMVGSAAKASDDIGRLYGLPLSVKSAVRSET
jgi:hypothetical protein